MKAISQQFFPIANNLIHLRHFADKRSGLICEAQPVTTIFAVGFSRRARRIVFRAVAFRLGRNGAGINNNRILLIFRQGRPSPRPQRRLIDNQN